MEANSRIQIDQPCQLCGTPCRGDANDGSAFLARADRVDFICRACLWLDFSTCVQCSFCGNSFGPQIFNEYFETEDVCFVASSFHIHIDSCEEYVRVNYYRCNSDACCNYLNRAEWDSAVVQRLKERVAKSAI